MKRFKGRLSAPHADIACSASRHSWGYVVEYIAPSIQSLLDAGCISVEMCSEIAKGQRRKSVEADGDQFYCRSMPIKSQPNRCRLARYISTAEKAAMLPGVLANLRHPQPPKGLPAQRLADYRGSLGDSSTAKRLPWLNRAAEAATRCFGLDVTVIERRRSLGRQQRPVTWATVGDLVLVPNWIGIRAAVEAARGAA